MSRMIVHNSKVLFKPDAGWQWFGWDGIISMQISESLFKICDLPVGVKDDILKIKDLIEGKLYTANGFKCPGNLSVNDISINSDSLCKLSTVNSIQIINENTVGTFTMYYSKPATTPKADPDPLPIKTGTFKFIFINQQISKEK